MALRRKFQLYFSERDRVSLLLYKKRYRFLIYLSHNVRFSWDYLYLSQISKSPRSCETMEKRGLLLKVFIRAHTHCSLRRHSRKHLRSAWTHFPRILSDRLFHVRRRYIMSDHDGHVGRASLNLTCAMLLLHVNLDISHRHRPAYPRRASSFSTSSSLRFILFLISLSLFLSHTHSISLFCSLIRNRRRAQMIPLPPRAFIYHPYFNHDFPQLAGVTIHFSHIWYFNGHANYNVLLSSYS